MREYETFQAIMLSLHIAMVASINYMAIVFAYLVAVFVTGKSLPKSAAVGTSFIYTIFLIPPFSSVLGNLNRVCDGVFTCNPLSLKAGR